MSEIPRAIRNFIDTIPPAERLNFLNWLKTQPDSITAERTKPPNPADLGRLGLTSPLPPEQSLADHPQLDLILKGVEIYKARKALDALAEDDLPPGAIRPLDRFPPPPPAAPEPQRTRSQVFEEIKQVYLTGLDWNNQQKMRDLWREFDPSIRERDRAEEQSQRLKGQNLDCKEVIDLIRSGHSALIDRLLANTPTLQKAADRIKTAKDEEQLKQSGYDFNKAVLEHIGLPDYWKDREQRLKDYNKEVEVLDGLVKKVRRWEHVSEKEVARTISRRVQAEMSLYELTNHVGNHLALFWQSLISRIDGLEIVDGRLRGKVIEEQKEKKVKELINSVSVQKQVVKEVVNDENWQREIHRLEQNLADLSRKVEGIGSTRATPSSTTPASQSSLQNYSVEQEDEMLMEYLRNTVVVKERPDVSFGDIGGQEDVVSAMKQLVIKLRFPQDFQDWGVNRPSRGVLVYGPPGTGKTLLAKALANELDTGFVIAKSSNLKSFWHGQSEKLMTFLFKVAREEAVKHGGLCIIFLDEIEAIARNRNNVNWAVDNRILSILLQEIEGFEEHKEAHVLVVAATNQPEMVDPAFVSRMSANLEMPRPNVEGIIKILEIHFDKAAKVAGRSLLSDGVNFQTVAESLRGYSGRDIEDFMQMVLDNKGFTQVLNREVHHLANFSPPLVNEDYLIEALPKFKRAKDASVKR